MGRASRRKAERAEAESPSQPQPKTEAGPYTVGAVGLGLGGVAFTPMNPWSSLLLAAVSVALILFAVKRVDLGFTTPWRRVVMAAVVVVAAVLWWEKSQRADVRVIDHVMARNADGSTELRIYTENRGERVGEMRFEFGSIVMPSPRTHAEIADHEHTLRLVLARTVADSTPQPQVVILPGDKRFARIPLSVELLERSDREAFLSGRSDLFLLGKVRYQDFPLRWRSVTFCASFSGATGASTPCAILNDVG